MIINHSKVGIWQCPDHAINPRANATSTFYNIHTTSNQGVSLRRNPKAKVMDDHAVTNDHRAGEITVHASMYFIIV